jgi:hypothetical protein
MILKKGRFADLAAPFFQLGSTGSFQRWDVKIWSKPKLTDHQKRKRRRRGVTALITRNLTRGLMYHPAKTAFVATIFFAVASGHTFAQETCLTGSVITKWEVIGPSRLLAYQGNKYLAFVSIYYGRHASSDCHMETGQNVKLRFFSPSICARDHVMVNAGDCLIEGIELVRQQ